VTVKYVIGVLLLIALPGFCQTPNQTEQKLAFEVVAIKPAPAPTPETLRSGARRIGMRIDRSRVDIGGYSVVMLLSTAFRVARQQVAAPDFASSEYFDIQAKLPEGAARDQVPEMLQAMLEERFKLSYHHETRDYPLTFLTLGKTGMKLHRLPDDTPPSTKSTPLPDGGARMTLVGKLSGLFPVMNSFGGLQVVDETGLDGIYTWVREQHAEPGVPYQEVVQQGFRAMLEAAGLKMETRKVPKDTIVVDHVEKLPAEN
jgi:uncharacterized protein (TIGR03435 family)